MHQNLMYAKISAINVAACLLDYKTTLDVVILAMTIFLSMNLVYVILGACATIANSALAS